MIYSSILVIQYFLIMWFEQVFNAFMIAAYYPNMPSEKNVVFNKKILTFKEAFNINIFSLNVCSLFCEFGQSTRIGNTVLEISHNQRKGQVKWSPFSSF